MTQRQDFEQGYAKLRARLGLAAGSDEALRLHGLVTAIALTPWDVDLDDLVDRMAPSTFGLAEDPDAMALLHGAVIDAIEGMVADEWSPGPDLAAPAAVQTRFMASWYGGLEDALATTDGRWQALEDFNPMLGLRMAILRALAGADTKLPMPGPGSPERESFLRHHLEQLPELLSHTQAEAETADYDLEREQGLRDQVRLPAYDDAELARMGAVELLDTLVRLKDMAPRNLFDATLARGEELLPRIIELTRDPVAWSEPGAPEVSADEAERRWWGVIHGVHLLGEMEGKTATTALLDVLERLGDDSEPDLFDWLASHWPQLFANKGPAPLAALERLMEDPAQDPYVRGTAMECVAALSADDPALLERQLDRIAALLDDEAPDSPVQQVGGHVLLDNPRERHRGQLLRLAETFSDELFPPFDQHDVEKAYSDAAAAHNRPGRDHLNFYDREAIVGRQIRWIKQRQELEIAHRMAGPTAAPMETVRREGPKVGRNDPCPCGSGRKYKKCCLNKAS